MAYLQSSGAISISDINTVFSRGNDLNSYRGTTWYTAAGGSGTFSSGAISMSDFYSKGPNSPITVSLSSLNGVTLNGTPSYSNEAYSIDLYFNTDGTWIFYGYMSGDTGGNWATPTTTGIGSSYWIKFTRTFFAGGLFNSATGTTGWQQISTARIITVSTGGYDAALADYTVEIATDSSGTNVVATASLSMVALVEPG